MNKNPMKEGDVHHHVWLPWGSEVDDDWMAINNYVHVKCIGYDQRKPCKATEQLTSFQWVAYRNSLSKYQGAGNA